MSVEMPITATALPSESNTGVLWVRYVRPPQPSSTSIVRYGRSPMQAAQFWGGAEMIKTLKSAGGRE